MQPKSKGVAQHLPAQQRFGEYICSHVICGAVADVYSPTSHDLADEVEANVNVLGPCMIVIICGQLQGSLVVAV